MVRILYTSGRRDGLYVLQGDLAHFYAVLDLFEQMGWEITAILPEG